MAIKSLHILLAVISLLAVAVPILADSENQLVGGWRPIKNLKAREVVAIAKFAVKEYNKEKKMKLIFVKVEKGEMQVVAGTNYKLVIAAVVLPGTSNLKTYTAVVFQGLDKKTLKLVSFK